MAEKAKKKLSGRRVLYSNETVITRSNIVEVLNSVLTDFNQNKADIIYLYNYYRNIQPVDKREKKFRPDIKNTVVINHAYEVVSFRLGYDFGDPVQYVRRADKPGHTDNTALLNDIMTDANKQAKDIELAEWFYICGCAYRMTLPSTDDGIIEIDILDPRYTGVVYNRGFGKRPLMSIQEVADNDGESHYYCYTPTSLFHIYKNEIVSEETHILGAIPIVEYVMNSTRQGAFEPIIEILDSINLVNSNRIDGIEQFVQSFIRFINANISKDDFKEFLEMGAIKVMSEPGMPADVSIISAELNQDQVQTLVDYLYQTAMAIVGVPNRNGQNRSTSDTGQGVVLREGWANAETVRRNVSEMFKISEKRFLKLVKKICWIKGEDFNISDIDIKFNHNRTDNIQTKAQVLQSLLESGINPLDAITASGIWGDPVQICQNAKPYLDAKWLTAEEVQKREALRLTPETENYTPSNNKSV